MALKHNGNELINKRQKLKIHSIKRITFDIYKQQKEKATRQTLKYSLCLCELPQKGESWA